LVVTEEPYDQVGKVRAAMELKHTGKGAQTGHFTSKDDAKNAWDDFDRLRKAINKGLGLVETALTQGFTIRLVTLDGGSGQDSGFGAGRD
jgi:hypothetical protein